MKQQYSIFVEGEADKRFISQLILVLLDGKTVEDHIFVTNGLEIACNPSKRDSVHQPNEQDL